MIGGRYHHSYLPIGIGIAGLSQHAFLVSDVGRYMSFVPTMSIFS